MRQEWPSFHSTPCEYDSEDVSQKPSFAQGRGSQDDEDEDDVPIKSFGKVKVEMPRQAQ